MSGDLHLGKLPAQPHAEDFKLAEFVVPGFVLPEVLPTRWGHGNLFAGDDWLMFGNGPDDTVQPGYGGAGDCVFAAIGHVIKMEAKLHRRTVHITGKECIQAYSEVTGYVLGDESTDNGTIMQDAMSWWRKEGFPDADGNRHKIAAYLSFDAKDLKEHQQAAYLLGFTLIGFVFPDSAWQQFDAGQPWTYVPGARSDGGHCVPEVGSARAEEITIVTWARRQEIMRDFLQNQNDEAWAVVFPETLNTKGVTERGLDVTRLTDALNSLK